MKKISVLMLIFVVFLMSFSLCSCSSSERLIDDVDKVEKISITKKSTDETIELNEEQIQELGNMLLTSVDKESFQDKWNSMGNSNNSYTTNYRLQITTKKTFFKKSKTYGFSIGKTPKSDSDAKPDPTYVIINSKTGTVNSSAVDYIDKLFITENA